MAKLAFLLLALGRHKPALDLISSCIDLSPHVLGPDHGAFLRFKTQCETELSSQARAEAVCNMTDRPAGDAAGIVQSVRSVFAAMKFG